MSAARNKANYLKAKELFNQDKVAECILYYSEFHEIKSSPAEKGRGGIQKFLEGLRQTWGNIQINVDHVLAEGDYVMGKSTATATHVNPVLGVAPTGKEVVTTFWDLHLFDKDGLIIESWNLVDNMAIMRQLGMLK